MEAELSTLLDKDMCGGFLDYTKDFDRFSFQFTASFLSTLGLPQVLTNVHLNLNANLPRHIRLGKYYAAPIVGGNGLSQSCIISVVAALAHVAVQSWMIEDKHPDVTIASCLDDRQIYSSNPDHVLNALKELDKYDRLSGHQLNLSKLSFFANRSSLRTKLRK